MKEDLTLCVIKPYAIKKKFSGAIIKKIEEVGFTICAIRMTQMTKEKAERFYGMHAGKSFFDNLTDYMSSGHIIALVLFKPNAVDDFRLLIGTTDPKIAAHGTLRKLFGTSLQKNALHGSDSVDNATREIALFFENDEIFIPDFNEYLICSF